MTYLDLVNNVLRRMREDEVTSVSESSYSKLVGDFVNDAKQFVESAWDWSALRTTITITTTPGVFNYSLLGSQNKINVLDVINDTSNNFMDYKSSSWFNNTFLNQTPGSGSPQSYTFNGVNDDGDTQIDIYPIPDAAYDIRVNVIHRGTIYGENQQVIRPEILSADSDKVVIPHMPVLHMAIALLARERGETGGTSAAEYFGIADKYMSDAIAFDAQKHPDEITWYVS